MIKKTAAFTLLELMVYMTLVAILALASGGFFSTIYSSLIQMRQQAVQELENEVMIDVIARDLMSASSDAASWDTKNFVCTSERLDATFMPVRAHVGWEMTTLANGQPAARRSEGNYNFRTHQWIRRSVSVIGCPFTILRLGTTMSTDQRRVTHALIRYAASLTVPMHERVVKIRSRVLV